MLLTHSALSLPLYVSSFCLLLFYDHLYHMPNSSLCLVTVIVFQKIALAIRLVLCLINKHTATEHLAGTELYIFFPLLPIIVSNVMLMDL